MQLTYKILLIIILPIVFILPQKESKLRTHNFSGSSLVSINGIFTLGYSDYSNGKIVFGAAGMAEYFIPTHSSTIFGLRLLFGGQTVSGKDKFKDPTEFMTDMYILGGGLILGYTFDNEFFPYVYGGVSNLLFSPKDKNGKRLLNNSLNAYSRSTIAYDAEIGSRIVLQDRLSMFFGVGVHFVQTDNFEDITAGENDDFYYSGRIGVSFTLFSRKDSDGDGIWDSDDACPSNPEDYDGFQDEDGCPDYDNDKDKVLDEIDKCPNDLDKCPDQAETFNGFQDEDGCPDSIAVGDTVSVKEITLEGNNLFGWR